MCDHTKRIGLCLEMSADVPTETQQERWCGEPIKSLIIPTSIFLTNKKGFPVLSKAHQNFVKRLFKVIIMDIITNKTKDMVVKAAFSREV